MLASLLSGAQAILGEQFVGLYLYGSLASGDFDPQRSDVDFVAVSADDVPADRVPALEAMHARLAASGLKWAPKLEGAYLSRGALRRHDPAGAPCPQINEGRFHVASVGNDWIIQREILREQGVVVAGPAPRTLIDPVQPDDLREAVRGILREWWAPMLADPAFLRRREYQAFAVLSMCRALYTLRYGTLVSKPAAARWAWAAIDAGWVALIERSLAWQADDDGDDLRGALDLIGYTLERAGLSPQAG